MGRTWYLSHVCCVLSPHNYMLFICCELSCPLQIKLLQLTFIVIMSLPRRFMQFEYKFAHPISCIVQCTAHWQMSGGSPDLGFWIWDFWFWLWDFEFRILDLEFRISIDKYQVWALSVHGESERVVLSPGKLAHLLSACKNFPCWHQMSQRWRELFLWVLSGVGGWLIAQLDWFVFLIFIFIYMSTDKYKRHSRAICWGVGWPLSRFVGGFYSIYPDICHFSPHTGCFFNWYPP